jgi:hypothetical protein
MRQIVEITDAESAGNYYSRDFLPPAWKILRGIMLQRQDRRYLILSLLFRMRYPVEDGGQIQRQYFVPADCRNHGD